MVVTMSVLRFLSVFFVCILLLNIFLKRVKNETQNPIILLAIDNSKSIIALNDSSNIKTEFVEKIERLKLKIGEDFSVKPILFGSNSKAEENNPDFSEKETDIDNLINDVENNYSNQNVGALILISDGIYNKGSNPVYGIDKLQYPVYTVAMGDTNEIKDIAIQKINHNQFAYLGNIFPAEVVLNCKKFSGKQVTITVTDSRGKKTTQDVKIPSDNYLTTQTFTFNAETGGAQKYSVNVTVLDGEKNVSNNNQFFVIDIIDNRAKVLLLASYPHPDIIAIKEAMNANSSYELETSNFTDFKKPVKPYSLVILHGYNNQQQAFVNDCRNNNIPVWFVNPANTEGISGLKISASNLRQNDAEATLNNAFGLFNVSDELKNFIKDLPAVKTPFGNYSISNGAVSLIQQKIGSVETENPILIFNETNGLKTAVFIGDGLWRWRFRDFEEHKNTTLFNELISKSVQYLSVKSDKSFFRITAPKIINENEPVEINAEVYNKSYELITEPDVILTLINQDKKQFNYTFSKTSTAHKLNIGLLPPGEYRYEAKVKINGELFVKSGAILVKEIVAERINTVANHQLLYQLSYRTGGKMIYPKDIETLAEEIKKNPLVKPITYSTNTTTSPLDLKWLLYLIVGLLAAEWFLRKRFTSI